MKWSFWNLSLKLQPVLYPKKNKQTIHPNRTGNFCVTINMDAQDLTNWATQRHTDRWVKDSDRGMPLFKHYHSIASLSRCQWKKLLSLDFTKYSKSKMFSWPSTQNIGIACTFIYGSKGVFIVYCYTTAKCHQCIDYLSIGDQRNVLHFKFKINLTVMHCSSWCRDGNLGAATYRDAAARLWMRYLCRNVHVII